MAIYVNVLARVGMVVLLQSLKVKKEKLQFTFRAFLINSNSLTLLFTVERFSCRGQLVRVQSGVLLMAPHLLKAVLNLHCTEAGPSC